MRNPVPRVAAIHDLSGFGRASLTVAIPVLSVMGVQACPLPTAVLSTHTVEYTGYTLLDLASEMERILDHWEALGLVFNGVYSGFTASVEQMASVARCIRSCLAPDGLAVVDPVLGDNGVLDPTMTPEMVRGMRRLICEAHAITPNYTEVCLLLGDPYRRDPDPAVVMTQLRRLAEMGPGVVVATSVPLAGRPDRSAVFAYERQADRFWKADCSIIPAHYPGTGDAFASVLTGSLILGDSLPLALDRAVQFVTLAIRATFGLDMPTREGILLERALPALRAPLSGCVCELVSSSSSSTSASAAS